MTKTNKYNILVATDIFGLCGNEPVELLTQTGWNIKYNSLSREAIAKELVKMLNGIDGVIAGTEPYNAEVLSNANNLKVISRVGVGLDNIDFEICKKRGIIVTYTPEAPSEGVADLTIAQIINLFRSTFISNISVKKKGWNRIIGFLLSEKKIGVLGVGRIGTRVVKRLRAFGVDPVYTCDIEPKEEIEGVKWVSKEELFRTCDLITIHIPLNEKNYHCIGLKEMIQMKEGSFLVNTSRGPIVDEKALESSIINRHLAGAALDVFEKEPYEGILREFDNVLLTAHLGSSTNQSRFLMEYEATEDCIRVLQGKKPLRPVFKEII